MNLPPGFIANLQNTFGERGRRFLDNLPALIEAACQRWDLHEIQPVKNLSYNFVAFASCSQATPGAALRESTPTPQRVVLKIGVPHRELSSEIAALRLFNGQATAQLLAADDAHGMLLQERLEPGGMLSALEDDQRATQIAADLMLRLWQPLPGEPDRRRLSAQAQASDFHRLIKLSDWFDGLKRLRPMFGGGTGPFPQPLVARVERLLPQLYAESSPPCLIHGDLHHFNILSSERGWLAIDPKGVVGPPEYEVAPLLINQLPDLLNWTNARVRTEKRLAILSERLGFPRRRLKDWALCHALLSAWWDTGTDGTGGEYSIRCAELFLN